MAVLSRALIERAAKQLGYDKTHITRSVAYETIDTFLDTLDYGSLDVLEISAGWKWRDRAWHSFAEMNWPDHDICNDVLDAQFDLIIADNVFEHLKYPYRAAQHVYQMLKPGGRFINITPFMIRYHPIPIDCTRWTETGMVHFLEEVGFDPAKTVTGSWGNKAAVKANFGRWARRGWAKHLHNDPHFPVTVWAIAQKD